MCCVVLFSRNSQGRRKLWREGTRFFGNFFRGCRFGHYRGRIVARWRELESPRSCSVFYFKRKLLMKTDLIWWWLNKTDPSWWCSKNCPEEICGQIRLKVQENMVCCFLFSDLEFASELIKSPGECGGVERKTISSKESRICILRHSHEVMILQGFWAATGEILWHVRVSKKECCSYPSEQLRVECHCNDDVSMWLMTTVVCFCVCIGIDFSRESRQGEKRSVV